METVFKDWGASFCRNFDQQPFEVEKWLFCACVGVYWAIQVKTRIAQGSCMIHWLYAVILSSKATIIGTCSKLPASNSVCLEQVNLRKKIELKVIKVASLNQVSSKYSGLKDRFGRIYHRLYICSVMINWTVSSENCDKGYYQVLCYRTFSQNILRFCPQYLIIRFI